MKVFQAPLALLMIVSSVAVAQAPMKKSMGMEKSMLMSMDKTFVTNAGHSDAAEIAMAKMAKMKSKNPTVLKFADMMISEHTMMHADLKKAVMGRTMVPDKPNAMQMKMAAKLNGMSGMAFDKAYMMANVDGHKAAYANAVKGSKMSSDPALKAFFTKGAPKIKMHLDMAMKDQKMMMSGKAMPMKGM